MKSTRFKILIFFIFALVFVIFQNCSGKGFSALSGNGTGVRSLSSANSNNTNTSGNDDPSGHYVIRATCVDGSSISSEVDVVGPLAFLVRSNCQNIQPPMSLQMGTYHVTDGVSLTYNGQTLQFTSSQ